MDPIPHIAFGPTDGNVATGSMLVGLGAVETGWGVTVTGVSFASTVGALGLTVAGVMLPTAAGAGSTQRTNGIRGAKEILRDGVYQISPPGNLIKLRNGRGWGTLMEIFGNEICYIRITGTLLIPELGRKLRKLMTMVSKYGRMALKIKTNKTLKLWNYIKSTWIHPFGK